MGKQYLEAFLLVDWCQQDEGDIVELKDALYDFRSIALSVNNVHWMLVDWFKKDALFH